MTSYSSLPGLIVASGFVALWIARRVQAKKIHGKQVSPGSPAVPIPVINKKMLPAELTYARIVQLIEKNQQELKSDEHLLVLGACANGETLIVGAIGFVNPDLILLSGSDSHGDETHVLIHFSRIHVTCKKTKIHSKSKVCTIGFRGECP